MKKYLVLALLFSLALAFLLYPVKRTGMVSDEASAEMYVTVSQYIYDIIVECQQDAVNVGESVSANITVTNNGGYIGDINITWWIEDSYGTTYTSGSSVVALSPSESWISTKSLLVPSTASAGIYFYKARVSVDGAYSNTAYDTFEVNVPEAAVPRGEARPFAPTVVTLANMEIIYDANPVVIIGTSREYDVKVKNTGGLVLHNLMLYLQGLEFEWYSITPESVNLNVGENITFKVNYTVPGSAEIKKYAIKILLKSDELEESIYLSLNAIKILKETEFELERARIEGQIRELEEKIKELEERDIDVAAIRKLLDATKNDLNLAITAKNNGDLKTASELIYGVKSSLQIIEELIETVRPYRPWMTYVAAILAVLVLALLIIYYRLKKKRLEEEVFMYRSFARRVESLTKKLRRKKEKRRVKK